MKKTYVGFVNPYKPFFMKHFKHFLRYAKRGFIVLKSLTIPKNVENFLKK